MADKDFQFPGSFLTPKASSKFSLTVSVTEFQLAMGNTRMGFSPDGSATSSSTEYHDVYSISPSAAVQLGQILAVAVDNIKKNLVQFLKI
jgi:hypothetical protein